MKNCAEHYRSVDAMVRKVVDHFDCPPSPDIHVGASGKPFQKLLSTHGEVLRNGSWVCRRSPSKEAAEAVLACLGELGMTIERSPDGWEFVYAFKQTGGDEV